MILVLNTATVQFSVALMDPSGAIKAEFALWPSGGHFREMMPAVEYVLQSAQITVRDLQAVATAQGPGSFTGLRVGLAFAKGLCQAQNIPAIAVSSLEAFAAQLPFVPQTICPLIASRRGEVFAALYEWEGVDRLKRLTAETTLPVKDLPGFVREPVVFIGDHLSRLGPELRKVFGPDALMAPPDLWLLRAGSVGRLGFAKFLKKEFTEIDQLNPAYMRPPDIRPNPVPPRSEAAA